MAGAFCGQSLPEVASTTGRSSQPAAFPQPNCCHGIARGTRRSRKVSRPELALTRQSRSGRTLHQVTRAVAEIDRPTSSSAGEDSVVTIDNNADEVYTRVSVETASQPGLLPALSSMFQDFGVDVVKTTVDGSGGRSHGQFFVQSQTGGKLSEGMEVERLQRAIKSLLDTRFNLKIPRRPQVGGTRDADQRTALLYGLMDTFKKSDVLSIQQSIVNHVEYTIARSRYKFDNLEAYQAAAFSLRDRLIESWNDTQQYFKDEDPKRVYYLSMEFLMGRSLTNALCNLGMSDSYTTALREMGYDLETLVEQERDAALGNGGLGRLAACFLDSMATLNLPAWGYGIRYQYGMFRQNIIDGFQHEQPDYWLNFGNPWEIERLNVAYPIKFYGHVSVHEEMGRQVFRWNPGESVTAVAYDNPIPGYHTNNTINLRLWAAKPDREFDLEAFNTGDYVQAVLSRQRAETLSSVLYPDDRTYEGKELRLKQQHFFVSATTQDVVRRWKETHSNFDNFAEKVAFQLNDTHPTIAVPELMRVLMDENQLGWSTAWNITSKVFAFTNHTVLPEALEKWPVGLVEKLLPRHMQIIYDINWRFLNDLRKHYGDDWSRISRMSIIEESGSDKFVRMAYLALVASHTVNGVAALHTSILKESIFRDFVDLWPHKFQNKTNGVTPRRWLAFCNPSLAALITKTLGSDAWINDLTKLSGLRKHAEDAEFRQAWRECKLEAKTRAMAKMERLTGIKLKPEGMLDIQVKRIHEYKRQLLNILGAIYRYNQIRQMSPEEKKQVVPRVIMIGGKAAPGYEQAKRIIKLASAVGEKVNSDPDIGDLLKVVFVPDYNVSTAEALIPGSELSQHISTAGTEASGTSNMKFVMNGSLIIGTMDGANIEIAREIGEENMFIFGARKEEVPKLRQERIQMQPDQRFLTTVDLIRSGHFGWEDYFQPLVSSILGTDYYLLAHDFPSYVDTQERIDTVYKDQDTWTKMSIMSTAGSAFFSADRTISEYAKDIWKVEPCHVPWAEEETPVSSI